MKKVKIISSLVIATIAIILFQGSAPPAITAAVDPQVASLEQTPPELTNIKVQKLLQPIGANTMVMRIGLDTSVCYETISDSLNVYYDSTLHISFSDNGIFPDSTAGDGEFAALIPESITTFRAEMVNRINALTAAGKYLKFTGHSGKWITTIPTFDFISFDGYAEADLDPEIASYVRGCGMAKEKSLFITDVSVVEDNARTYNVVTGAGNKVGVWTFGHMIRGMCGNYTPGLPLPSYHILPRDLLKSWVANWTYLKHQINDQDVYERTNVYDLLIKPWLVRAGVSIPAGVKLDHSNWSDYWDMINTTAKEEELLNNAPFKLTAIVNRLDLRGNTSFKAIRTNSGETRFIYTLVNYTNGEPVKHPDQGAAPTDKYIDWEGLNVILEYGNVQTNNCALKAFAQQWADLSSYPMPSPAYNDALEQITNTVTEANAGGLGKPNSSALNRMRTNEKIFEFASVLGHTTIPDDVPSRQFWEEAEWEFRQFEINPTTHEFEQVVLTNTIRDDAISTENLHTSPKNGILTKRIFPTTYTYSPITDVSQLVNYPFYKKAILRGNVNLPSYSPFTSNPILAPIGWVKGEFSNYVDGFSPLTLVTLAEKEEYENLRHQLSLNTCEGCHTGETKTMFTHIAPMKYGKTADFWGLLSEQYQSRVLDVRGTSFSTLPFGNDSHVPINGGQTQTGTSTFVDNYITQNGKRSFYQYLSPFLTGKLYSGVDGTTGTFDDDFDDPIDNIDDNNMDGLYYVYDPSNHASPTSASFLPATNVFGYNDLQRRLDDLCLFLHTECSLNILNLGARIKFVPLPLGGH